MRDNVRENLFEEGGAGESVRKGFNGNRGGVRNGRGELD